MRMQKTKQIHPYHYSTEKNIIQKIIDFGFPILLFWLYFQFYNFGKITPSEMIKTSGLVAIALLSITLGIGPLCRFIPFLNDLKAHRKVWGIASFLFAFIHTSLIYVYFFKYDLSKFVNFSNPKYLGLLAGIVSLLILFIVTLTSYKKFLDLLSPRTWKIIQTTSYLALMLAVVHFYIVESTNGVLVIKRLLGQITFGFAAIVVLIRLLVILLPTKTR